MGDKVYPQPKSCYHYLTPGPVSEEWFFYIAGSNALYTGDSKTTTTDNINNKPAIIVPYHGRF